MAVRGALQGLAAHAVPTDPLIYRWYEIVSVYGTIKELIHEEFGDGIMSAIDFSMDIQRQPDPRATASTWCCPASSCPTRPTEPGGRAPWGRRR
jgi:cyanate lyase